MNPDSAIGRFVDRHAWLRIPVEVVTRTTELNGNYAANALTLVGFIALFPLLLLIISITGLLTGSNPHLASDVIDFLGLQGQTAETVDNTLQRARESGTSGSVVGLAGLAWSGLSLVGALRFTVNLPAGYAVRGLRARLIGIPWLLGAGGIFLMSWVLSTILGWLPGWSAPVVLVLSLGLDVALFGWTFWFLAVDRPSLRTLLPGALVAAIGFELLKTGATIVLPRLVSSSSATYGGLGTVFAILAWLLIFSRLLVYSVVFNAVWADEHALPTGPDDTG